MQKYLANSSQDRHHLPACNNLSNDCSGLKQGAAQSGRVSVPKECRVESWNALASLNRELTALNEHIRQYALESSATCQALKNSAGPYLSGRAEMLAELGRMTTRIIVDIRWKQALLANATDLLKADRFSFAPEYDELCSAIKDACGGYHDLLEQIEVQILSFSAYMSLSHSQSTLISSMERQPQVLCRFSDVINAQIRKLSSAATVFSDLARLTRTNKPIPAASCMLSALKDRAQAPLKTGHKHP